MGSVRLPLWSLPLLVALIAVATALGLAGRRGQGSLPAQDLELLRLVHARVLAEHVEAHGPGALVERAIAGMVRGLDRYSRFVPAAEVARFETATTGAYEGIGVQMAQGAAPPAVLFPHPGGPAERAGLRPGDRILAVDGTAIDATEPDAAMAQARERIRGLAGTSVRLQVARGAAPPFEVTCERASVQLPSVRWTRLVDEGAGIGYAHLHAFQRASASELASELAWLRGQPGGLRALILDVRGNSGGLLDQSIALANRFLARGVIVTLRERGGRKTQHEAAPERCTEPDLPLVLLVDEHSASASEVLAGALQDHRRARIVGTRTFGKGMVQTIFRWQGHDARLKLTTSHYFTPSGRSLEGPRPADGGAQTGGVVPDRLVELAPELRDRVRVLLADHGDFVPRPYRAAAAALAAELARPLREPAGPDEDAQLAAAVAECRALVAGGNGGR
jgi:carboxyl-terminal processing protease